MRRKQFDAVASHIDIPGTGRAHHSAHRQDAALPALVEDRLVGLGVDFAKAIHAPHVVDAIHQATSPGFLGKPVPIMQSRVTSVASFSSLQPLVWRGRIGKTRKRVSAVESHTRISVVGGSDTSKSASTLRGTFTARER